MLTRIKKKKKTFLIPSGRVIWQGCKQPFELASPPKEITGCKSQFT